jgi:hypothetical protein
MLKLSSARSSFAAVASIRISYLSPNLPVRSPITDSYVSDCSSIMQSGNSTGTYLYYGVSIISALLQMFVLGPRLVLSVREHSTKLVADSDEATNMTTITFERTPVSTCDSV